MKKITQHYKKIVNSKFGKNTIVRYVFLVAISMTALNLALLIFFWKATSEPLPLVFTTFHGAVATGPWYMIYQYPILSLLIIALNGYLAYYAYEKDRLISYILAGAAVLVSVILLVNSINFIGLV